MRCNDSLNFGPRNADEERIFAEESFRIDVQVAIHELMETRGVSQRELAKRMGVSEARVSQIFSDECNITVRTLARLYHALGATPQIATAHLQKQERADWHVDPRRDGASISAADLLGFARVLGAVPTRYAAPEVSSSVPAAELSKKAA